MYVTTLLVSLYKCCSSPLCVLVVLRLFVCVIQMLRWPSHSVSLFVCSLCNVRRRVFCVCWVGVLLGIEYHKRFDPIYSDAGLHPVCESVFGCLSVLEWVDMISLFHVRYPLTWDIYSITNISRNPIEYLILWYLDWCLDSFDVGFILFIFYIHHNIDIYSNILSFFVLKQLRHCI